MSRRRGRTKVLLLDMDGTVTTSRYVVELARACGHEAQLASLLDGHDDAVTRSERIASLFKFVHKQQFERVALALPLRPDAVETVNRLRREGFMVGLVSDSYFVAAEIVRRRIFADFALAHTLKFDNDICSGELRISAAFGPLGSGAADSPCKSNVVKRFRHDEGTPVLDTIWAVGDNVNDLEMLKAADKGFIIEPKSPQLAALAGGLRIDTFSDLVQHLPTLALPARIDS